MEDIENFIIEELGVRQFFNDLLLVMSPLDKKVLYDKVMKFEDLTYCAPTNVDIYAEFFESFCNETMQTNKLNKVGGKV